jgi:hypothetical protein
MFRQKQEDSVRGFSSKTERNRTTYVRHSAIMMILLLIAENLNVVTNLSCGEMVVFIYLYLLFN